jgi:hypothetical protein
MGSFPLSLVPFQFESLQSKCAWAPEPVFPLSEAARILGIKKNAIRQIRKRHPEVCSPSKVGYSLYPALWPREIPEFKIGHGLSVNSFGAVVITLLTPGGPQPHVCLTHYGLFRHAVFVQTVQARRFVLSYPKFIASLGCRTVREPTSIAALYQAILQAPWGSRSKALTLVAAQIHCPIRTMYRRLKRLRMGQVTPEGLPARKKPIRFLFPAQVMILRRSLGDSQPQFAQRVGVDPTTVRDWESGKYGMRRSTIPRVLSVCPTPQLRELFAA